MRQWCVPVAGLLILAALAAPTAGAAPAPDPPPLAVAPDPPPATTTRSAPKPAAPAPAPAPVRRTVARPAPVVQPATVATVAPAPPAAKPKPTPAAAAPKRAAKPKPKPTSAPIAVPHDRAPLGLAAFVEASDPLNTRLLAAAGIALLFAALGSGVLVGTVRKAALLGVLTLAFAAPAMATPTVTFSMTGTAGANGWFRSNVTIHWVVTEPASVISSSGCEPAQLVTTEGQSSHTCTVTFAGGSNSSTAMPKIDKTPPTVSGGSPSRGPDANGWYNQPVAFAFSGTDATSGIAGCSSPTYSGGDGASVAVSGTCTDVAGNTSGSATVSFKYDATPPAVTAAPDRQPDGAWYRKPLAISFAGTDATSGIAACAPPVTYRGPEGAEATVKGACTDAAGNAAEAAFTFKYDASAPKLAKPRVVRAPGEVRITWPATADVASTQIIRTPGLRGKKSSVVYTGKAAVFVDRAVKAGARYRYQLVVADAAGNKSGRVVTAGPLAPLYGPVAGEVLRAPPLLRWQSQRGAAFYNVQLFRNGKKVLTAWPRGAQLRLARAWRYQGTTQRLVPGRYTWYVWAARGTKARPVYGRVLGSSTFVVRR